MVIVYTSNGGHTRQYAELLAEAEGMQCYELTDADKVLEKGTDIFYMGPLITGHLQGLDYARKFTIKAACGVGLSPPGEHVMRVIGRSNFLDDIPTFYLHGGWNPKELGVFQRQMVNRLTKDVVRQLQRKGNARTEWEDKFLDVLLKGGSFVAAENLAEVRAWLKENQS